jgi:CheY-like chemotaxis protein
LPSGFSRSEQYGTALEWDRRYIEPGHFRGRDDPEDGRPIPESTLNLSPRLLLLPGKKTRMTRTESNSLETILVAEDHPVVLEAIRETLERAGYCVLTAGNGVQAIRMEGLTEGTIHLLLSDVMMPDVSGPVVAGLLKNRRPEMRVMLMSGYSEGDLLLLKHGWHFIAKPFAPAALLKKVNEVLHTPDRSRRNDQFDIRVNPITSGSAA